MNPYEKSSYFSRFLDTVGDEYIVRLNDDLTGLTQHTFRVHGLIKVS